MHLRLLALSILFLFHYTGFAQKEGCNDPQAINYDKDAVMNDGSCLYSPKSVKPKTMVDHLPDSVMETSGLIWWKGSIWTHNDSEGGNYIFRLDSASGKIIQRVQVASAGNFDWEDMDQDHDYIYIGDFGNNWGSRTDLVIYKIAKAQIPDTGVVAAESERIYFSYGDQTDYSVRNRSNDYDCEAMISFGDSLYLFTKNWVSQSSRLYALPKVPGNYVIYPLDEFNADGLITGAALNGNNNELVLCGYRNYIPFVWVLSDYWKNDFFGGNKRRIDLRKLAGTQTEGVTWKDQRVFILSSEKTLINDAKLFKIDLKRIL